MKDFYIIASIVIVLCVIAFLIGYRTSFNKNKDEQ